MHFKKIRKMNELSWVFGMLLCPLGVCLCTKANFGLSMIAALPYIIHLKMSTFFSWYTQGTSDYIWQAVLLVLMCLIVRRFRLRYLFSFLTAFINGNIIDMWFRVLGGNAAYEAFWSRVIAFVFGVLLTALAIAFYFRTKMPLQIYELIVTEISGKYNLDMNRVKQINDIAMLVLSIVLAITLNKSLRGIGVGTIIITAVNATLIAFFGRILNKIFSFEMRFPLLEKIL